MRDPQNFFAREDLSGLDVSSPESTTRYELSEHQRFVIVEYMNSVLRGNLGSRVFGYIDPYGHSWFGDNEQHPKDTHEAYLFCVKEIEK